MLSIASSLRPRPLGDSAEPTTRRRPPAVHQREDALHADSSSLEVVGRRTE